MPNFSIFFLLTLSHALDQGLDLLKIAEVKYFLVLEFLKFINCTTPNSGTKSLRDFLNKILIC